MVCIKLIFVFDMYQTNTETRVCESDKSNFSMDHIFGSQVLIEFCKFGFIKFYVNLVFFLRFVS